MIQTIIQWPIHLDVPIYYQLDPVWPVKIAKCLLKLPKNDFTKKLKILTPLQKLHKNVRDSDNFIVYKGF